MERSLKQEAQLVNQLEALIEKLGPFVSLAEAARATKVPLATLSDAVRNGRVPALRVQPRRWLVRISAVEAYFDKSASSAAIKPTNPLLELAALAEGGAKKLSDMPTDFARNFDRYVYGTDKR